MKEHDYPPDRPGTGLGKVFKAMFFVVAGAAVLAVLAFGTCLLLLK